MKYLKSVCILVVVIALVFVSSCSTVAHDGAARLVDVRRIWDGGEHNAFTDLIRFNGQWYCTFREADKHAEGDDGNIRVIVSDDGAEWESAAIISEDGIDLRDPKLCITPFGKLMLLMGGSDYDGTKLVGRQSRVIFSEDGKNWSNFRRVTADSACASLASADSRARS